MPLNDGAKNEILPFATETTASTNVNGELLDLDSYQSCLERRRGHQIGIAKRGIANRTFRQTAFMAAGLAQFIANRYEPGVVDDMDLDKIEEGLQLAIEYVIENLDSSVSGAEYVGKIEFCSLRPSELPECRYFCNGDRFTVSSAQGQALLGLSAAFRADWGIVVSGDTINVPNLFSDGRGAFLRAVDGATRRPGSWEGDAVRNITGEAGPIAETFGGQASTSGAFYKVSQSGVSDINSTRECGRLMLDISRTVPTANENRPLNIGMTPVIYLGV